MTSIDLILFETKARFRRAYDAYRMAMVSAHEALPEAPNLFECIDKSVIDYYCRCADDLNRVELMQQKLNNL